ncbi:MAG: LytTR family DNA-binding domain-containing protein [Peptococcaceae bacterium]|nr:LytTR family DNA-binding domain-containing protein [Peptococcaceae bacterium]
MLRIGICDDQSEARMLLENALENIFEQDGAGAQFFQFSSGEGLLDWYDKHQGELDLVFLDMEMHNLSGLETARALRARDESLQLVFCTGYSDYVYDGYSVGALGYLLKPPSDEKLRDVLARARAALLKNLDTTYICRTADSLYRIPLAQILYFSSDRRKIHCVTKNRTYTFYGKLDKVAASVGAEFLRIHQRHLVHIPAITSVEASSVTLAGGETLPVSRANRTQVLLALTRSGLEG